MRLIHCATWLSCHLDRLAGEILMLPLLDGVQLGLFFLLILLCTKPVGLYLSKVLNPLESTFLDPVIKPLEKGTYKILSINPHHQQTWIEYLFSLLIFSFGSLLLTMLILFLQPYLSWNEEHLVSPSWHLNLNTAISFMTNTNWQSYAGETTLSYTSQMLALAVQNFLSPAVGLAAMAVLTRSLKRNQSPTVGYFWTDIIRIIYYLLVPLAILFGIFFMGEGVPQNLGPAVSIETVEGVHELIPQGPIASQEAIKLLGTNGGGFFNVNSAHPYENPTPLCNLLEMLALLLIPAAQIYYFGHEVSHKNHSWSIYTVAAILFLASAIFCIWSENSDTPLLTRLGLYGGNMEGKEMRFGVGSSAIFTSITTDSSCGAVNANLDSLTPLGGLVPLWNMQLSEIVFGGCGSGLCGMLIYVIVTIFIGGLVIGRTPEYLGKKIEAYDIKLTVVALLSFGFIVLSLTAWAIMSQWGVADLENKGPHGFTEIIYAFTSTGANNGSAFSGLKTNTPWYNTILGFSMLLGRFFIIVPVLALAGSFVRKKKVPLTSTAPLIHGTIFIVFLLIVILLFGALTFLPSLMMGPVLEQYFMIHGTLF